MVVSNPLSPNNDLGQISHRSIKGLSLREVMRILTASSHYCQKCMVARKDNF